MDTSPGPDPGTSEPASGEGGAPGPTDATGRGAGNKGGAEPADGGADSAELPDVYADDAEPADGWLDGTEAAGPHDPLRFNQWMKRSATGAVLSGIALGLQQALEPRRNLPAFVMEAPGEPEDPDALITLHFDPDDPTKSVAVIRGTGTPVTPTVAPAPPDDSPS